MRNQRGRCSSAIRGIAAAGGSDACDAGKSTRPVFKQQGTQRSEQAMRIRKRHTHFYVPVLVPSGGFPHSHTHRRLLQQKGALPVHSMHHPAHATYTHTLLAMLFAALLAAKHTHGLSGAQGPLHALQAVHSTARHGHGMPGKHTPSRPVLAQNKPRATSHIPAAIAAYTHTHTPALRHTHTTCTPHSHIH
jgi:hypothetical protein